MTQPFPHSFHVEQSTEELVSDCQPRDNQLLEGIKNGDLNSFQTFYDRHSNRIHSLCFSILRDRLVAEQVLMNLFWDVWSDPERFREAEGSTRTTLLLQARRRALRRKQNDKSDYQDADSMKPILDFYVELLLEEEDFAEPASDFTWLHSSVFSELTEVQRRILHLILFEGFSASQISDDLKIPEMIVKSQLNEVLETLRLATSCN